MLRYRQSQWQRGLQFVTFVGQRPYCETIACTHIAAGHDLESVADKEEIPDALCTERKVTRKVRRDICHVRFSMLSACLYAHGATTEFKVIAQAELMLLFSSKIKK